MLVSLPSGTCTDAIIDSDDFPEHISDLVLVFRCVEVTLVHANGKLNRFISRIEKC